ncbi:penicillin-binding transpeptidase domain-containing protein [Furfurilactobacillus milii]|uniref:PASTA domain-containing protein n=1 Tax=Furfurilactobacillus milii TaxID=2888272 RepID=A0A6N9I573_9LACO|nr:penicillin-binding transpeptidase domain-containing protein [Furfurilactobacillus milii]MYV18121.1 PASTA domain-containing protein [Furfurilactobacillus milii]
MNKDSKRMSSPDNTRSNRRHFGNVLLVAILAVFILLGVRFVYIAVGKHVQHVSLSKQAQALYTEQQTIHAKRGTIYDADGNPIAMDTNTYTVYAVLNKHQVSTTGKPLYVTDKDKVAKVLSKTLNMSSSEILKILNPSNKNTFQVEFGSAGKDLSVATKQAIQKANLNGIAFTTQSARLYPNGIFASHMIGYAQPTTLANGASSLIGKMGIEQQLNRQLSGENGVKQIKHDSLGYTLPNSQRNKRSVKNGDNVYTTLNPDLQNLLENQMQILYSKLQPKNMVAMMVDTKTGKILAATQRPTFNASTMQGLGDQWNDLLVSDPYEPGSTMKSMSLAASIDSGNFKGSDTYQSGRYKIGNAVVPDWNPAGWGTITYSKGFDLSSNVAMAHLEQQMGASTWKKYIQNFGFLKSTNSGLPNEAHGTMQFTQPIEQANTAFGQGITVTPMQLMQAYTAIANNGKMLKPYYINKIVDPNTGKVVYRGKRQVVGNPISAETAKKVRQHMTDYVYKSYGMGKDFKIAGYKVAAKTGTAQVVGDNGQYMDGMDSTLNSVIGMVPAKNPRYLMYVTVNQPKKVPDKLITQWENDVFSPVMTEALAMDKDTALPGKATSTKVPKLVGTNVDDAKQQVSDLSLTPVVIGDGSKVTAQSPSEGKKTLTNQRIFLRAGDNLTMADMKGWSMGDVLEFAKLTGLSVQTSGSGYVTSQSLPAGRTIQEGTGVTVKFK